MGSCEDDATEGTSIAGKLFVEEKVVDEQESVQTILSRLVKSTFNSSDQLYHLDDLVEQASTRGVTEDGTASVTDSLYPDNDSVNDEINENDEQDKKTMSFLAPRIERLSMPPSLYWEEHHGDDGRVVVLPRSITTESSIVDVDERNILSYFGEANSTEDDEMLPGIVTPSNAVNAAYPECDEFSRVTVVGRSEPFPGRDPLPAGADIADAGVLPAAPEPEDASSEEQQATNQPITADEVEQMLNDHTVMIFVTPEGEICLRKVDPSIFALKDGDVVDVVDESKRAAVYHASVDEDGLVSPTRQVTNGANIEAPSEKGPGDIVIGHLRDASEIMDRFGKDIRASVDPEDSMDWDMIDKWGRAVGRTLAVNCVILLTGPAGGFAAGAGITASRFGNGAVNEDNREMTKAVGVWATATTSSCVGQVIGGAIGLALGGPAGLAAGAIIAGCCCGIAGGAMSEVAVDKGMNAAGLDEHGHQKIDIHDDEVVVLESDAFIIDGDSTSASSGSASFPPVPPYSTSGDRVRPSIRDPARYNKTRRSAMKKKLQPKRRDRLTRQQQQQAYF